MLCRRKAPRPQTRDAATQTEPPSRAELMRFTIEALRDELRLREMSVSGNKWELAGRLEMALHQGADRRALRAAFTLARARCEPWEFSAAQAWGPASQSPSQTSGRMQS